MQSNGAGMCLEVVQWGADTMGLGYTGLSLWWAVDAVDCVYDLKHFDEDAYRAGHLMECFWNLNIILNSAFVHPLGGKLSIHADVIGSQW